MPYLILFFSTWIYVTLKVFQQLNVQHGKYLWVPPVTFGMAVCEVITVTQIIQKGTLHVAVPMGIGGVLGCWFSMWFHKRLRKESNEPQQT